MTKEIDYSEFVKLFRTDDTIEANEYLDLGWILLNVEKVQVAEQSFNTYFMLGWNKPIDAITYGRSYSQRLKDGLKEKYGDKGDKIDIETNNDVPF
jgi:hypothetical protein